MNTAHDIIRTTQGWQVNQSNGTTRTFADLGEAIEWTAFGRETTPQAATATENTDHLVLGYN